MFESKAERFFTRVGFFLTLKLKARLYRGAWDKHSSLLQHSKITAINKMFYNFALSVKLIKLPFSIAVALGKKAIVFAFRKTLKRGPKFQTFFTP
jgi:hypothetical protein